MIFAVILAASASLAAAAPPSDTAALPDATRAELTRVESSAERSAMFRKLLSENDGLPRRYGSLNAPDFVRFEMKGGRALIYDGPRLKRATEWELQLAEARELARASIGLPVTLVEAEAAAWQKELIFALEFAAVQPEFSKAWAARASKAKDSLEAAGRLDAWARTAGAGGSETAPALPAAEFDRLALFSALLAQSPESFYDGVGALLPLPEGACRIAEVEDFTTLHAGEWRKAQPRDGEAFTLVGRSRYPTRVVRAARLLEPVGGADFARETIGQADAEGVELSTRLRHWLKWPTP
jgi:hypothetical protein